MRKLRRSSFPIAYVHFGLIIMRMTKSNGKIIISSGVDIWTHELMTAEALAEDGHIVEFLPKSNIEHQRTPDILLDGILYEMKSPTSSSLSVIEKNIKRALKQSSNIVVDSKRMKQVPDSQIKRELVKAVATNRKITSLLFVDKRRIVHKIK